MKLKLYSADLIGTDIKPRTRDGRKVVILSHDNTYINYACQEGENSWRINVAYLSGACNRSYLTNSDLVYEVEEKLVPWTKDNCPLGAEIVHKDGTRYLITGADDSSVYISGARCDYQGALKYYKQKDGSPCGTYEN